MNNCSSSNRKTTVTALTDTDPFQFGKYKGTPLKDVPASYLDWLRGQAWLSEWPQVAAYIEANSKVIDWEHKREGRD